MTLFSVDNSISQDRPRLFGVLMKRIFGDDSKEMMLAIIMSPVVVPLWVIGRMLSFVGSLLIPKKQWRKKQITIRSIPVKLRKDSTELKVLA